MADRFYIITILWRDNTGETKIICPSDMVLGIVETLPKFVIESMTILLAKEVRYDK